MTVPPPPPPPPSSPAPAGTHRVRLGIITAAVALVLVLVFTLLTVLYLRKDPLPEGMLTATYPTAPQQSWRTGPEDAGGTAFEKPNFRVGGDSPIGYIDGGDVIVVQMPGGRESLVGIDSATGDVRWRSGPAGGQEPSGCSEPLFGDRIACLSYPPGTNYPRFTFIALDDGRVLSSVDTTVMYDGVMQAGETLVFAGRDESGRVLMTGGTEQEPARFWSITGPTHGGTRKVLASARNIAVYQDISVTGGFTLAVDGSGRVLASEQQGYSTLLPNDSVAVYDPEADSSVVVAADGTTRYAVDGFLHVPDTNVPGEAPHLAFTEDSGYDLESGTRVWRISLESSGSTKPRVTAQVGAVALYTTLDSTVAVSALDGTILWQLDERLGYYTETDGTHLITTADERIVAYRLVDGTKVWDMPAQDDSGFGIMVGRSGGRLLLITDEVTGYEPTGDAAQTPSADLPESPEYDDATDSDDECPRVQSVSLDFPDAGVGSVTIRTRTGCIE